MELLPWILIVQLWTEAPPKIAMVYSKEYPNYAECMEARKEWVEKKLVAMCGVKNENSKTSN